MPQPDQPYRVQVTDSTAIEIAPSRLPKGFYKLDERAQDSVAREILITHIEKIQRSKQPPTAKDFLIPMAILLPLTAIVILLARWISKHPKLYDKFVRWGGDDD